MLGFLRTGGRVNDRQARAGGSMDFLESRGWSNALSISPCSYRIAP